MIVNAVIKYNTIPSPIIVMMFSSFSQSIWTLLSDLPVKTTLYFVYQCSVVGQPICRIESPNAPANYKASGDVQILKVREDSSIKGRSYLHCRVLQAGMNPTARTGISDLINPQGSLFLYALGTKQWTQFDPTHSLTPKCDSILTESINSATASTRRWTPNRILIFITIAPTRPLFYRLRSIDLTNTISRVCFGDQDGPPIRMYRQQASWVCIITETVTQLCALMGILGWSSLTSILQELGSQPQQSSKSNSWHHMLHLELRWSVTYYSIHKCLNQSVPISIEHQTQYMFGRFTRNRKLLAPLLVVTGFALVNYQSNPYYECCGILGAISAKNRAQIIVTEGIQLLQNRGYDSAGIATRRLHDDRFHITKMSIEQSKLCVQLVVQQGKNNHNLSYIGIGHTRWATCGNISLKNAHPHSDQSLQYHLIHNGTIVNYMELKQKYLPEVEFSSETDTEVIVQLLAKICKTQNLSVAQGLCKLKDLLIGQWGLVVLSQSKPLQMTIFTYGSPILVGFGEDQVFVASQAIAFQNYTKDYFSTQNGEILVLSLQTMGDLKQRMIDSNRLISIKTTENLKLRPSPQYKSFYQQQIQEQGTLVFKPYLKEMEEANLSQNLTIIGCGSSLHAAMYAYHFFKSCKSFNKVIYLDAAEVVPEDIQENDSIILVSQSGETKDLLLVLDISKKVTRVKTICVVNAVQSCLARQCDYRVFTNCGREVSVGATKSFTFQILNLLAIAVKIAQRKGHGALELVTKINSQLETINPKISQTLEQCSPKCKEVAKTLSGKSSLYIIAKGEALPIAKQGALKIKELCYIHAEAFGASQMKHGPIALINSDKQNDTVVILLVLKDKCLSAMKVALDEMHSRKAWCVVITDCVQELNTKKVGAFIQIPKDQTLRSLLCLYPLQVLANQVCLLKSLNPDKPRNLAKTVTV